MQVYKGHVLRKDRLGCIRSQLGSLQGLYVNDGTGDTEIHEGRMMPRHLLMSLIYCSYTANRAYTEGLQHGWTGKALPHYVMLCECPSRGTEMR